MILSDKNKYCI